MTPIRDAIFGPQMVTLTLTVDNCWKVVGYHRDTFRTFRKVLRKVGRWLDSLMPEPGLFWAGWPFS